MCQGKIRGGGNHLLERRGSASEIAYRQSGEGWREGRRHWRGNRHWAHIIPLEERFEVTRGSVAFEMDGREVVCGPGEGVAVPAWVPHTLHDAGAGEFELFGEYRPGMPEKSRRFHKVYYALARAGLTDGKGVPSLWQIAVEMPLVADHVHIASPPWPIERAFLALIRPGARLLGYRPFEQESAGAARVSATDPSSSR